jgi:hypothetical protein
MTDCQAVEQKQTQLRLTHTKPKKFNQQNHEQNMCMSAARYQHKKELVAITVQKAE